MKKTTVIIATFTREPTTWPVSQLGLKTPTPWISSCLLRTRMIIAFNRSLWSGHLKVELERTTRSISLLTSNQMKRARILPKQGVMFISF